VKCERLLLAASKIVLDLAGPETLPTIATDALVDGCDSPSLRILAGIANAQSDEARSLLAQALDELELPFPTARDAVMTLATDIATKVLDGTTAPFLGAQQIWGSRSEPLKSIFHNWIRLSMPPANGRTGRRTATSSPRGSLRRLAICCAFECQDDDESHYCDTYCSQSWSGARPRTTS
jgi:hypothetical protein